MKGILFLPTNVNRTPLRVSQEDLVDSVVSDATIYGSGGPHLGASTGPLFSAFHHVFRIWYLVKRETWQGTPVGGTKALTWRDM